MSSIANDITINIFKRLLEAERISYDDQKITNLLKAIGYDVEKELDEGTFSVAYAAREISTGNHVVIKLSRNENEWKKYDNAKVAKSKISTELGKHIPIIYFTGPLEEHPNAQGIKLPQSWYGTSLIIMEKLASLDWKTKLQVFRIDNATRAIEDDINKAVNELFEELPVLVKRASIHSLIRSKVLRRLIDGRRDLESVLFKSKSNQYGDPNWIRKELISWMKRCLNTESKDGINLFHFLAGGTKWFENLCEYTITWWEDAIIKGREISSTSDSQIRKKVYTTAVGQTFRELAKELHSAGYSYSDMHRDNIMMRPSTGDIVFADAGGFERIDNDK